MVKVLATGITSGTSIGVVNWYWFWWYWYWKVVKVLVIPVVLVLVLLIGTGSHQVLGPKAFGPSVPTQKTSAVDPNLVTWSVIHIDNNCYFKMNLNVR